LESEKEQLLAQLEQNQGRLEQMKQAFEQQAREVAAFPAQASEESKQAAAPSLLSPVIIERMNVLSDQLIEQRKELKPPANYPQREHISEFKEALNGTLRVATNGGTLDTLDVSTAKSGAILVTTSTNEIKILDASGNLSETLPIDNRVSLARFAPNSDSIAIFAFAASAKAQVWDLNRKQNLYEVTTHSEQITDISFPPLEGVVAVSSADGSWSLHDYKKGQVLLHLRE